MLGHVVKKNKDNVNSKSPFDLLLISFLSKTKNLEITKKKTVKIYSKDPYFYCDRVSQSTWSWFCLEYMHVNGLVMPCCIIYFKWILTLLSVSPPPVMKTIISSARLQQISSADREAAASVLTHMLIQIKFVRYYSEQTSLILIPAVRNCPRLKLFFRPQLLLEILLEMVLIKVKLKD